MPTEKKKLQPNEEVFTVQFDFIVPKPAAEYSKTLSQHEIFKLLKIQLHAAFDTEISRVQNFFITRKVHMNRGMCPLCFRDYSACKCEKEVIDEPRPVL